MIFIKKNWAKIANINKRKMIKPVRNTYNNELLKFKIEKVDNPNYKYNIHPLKSKDNGKTYEYVSSSSFIYKTQKEMKKDIDKTKKAFLKEGMFAQRSKKILPSKNNSKKVYSSKKKYYRSYNDELYDDYENYNTYEQNLQREQQRKKEDEMYNYLNKKK